MNFLRDERGGIIAAIPWLIFSIMMLYIAANIETPKKSDMTKYRLAEVNRTAARYEQMAADIESEDPDLAKQYYQTADELRKAARLANRVAQSKIKQKKQGLTGEGAPVVSLPKTPYEMTWKGRSPEEQALLNKLKKVNTRIGRSEVFRDIVKARLYAIYQALGGRFSKDGEPLDQELLDAAKKVLAKIYQKKHKNDPLARRSEYKKAWEEITGEKPGVMPKDGPWIVWYADNIAYKPLYLSTTSYFIEDHRAMDFEGGGMDPKVELKKVHALGPFPTRKKAVNAIWGELKNIRNLGGIYYYVRVADFRGKMHNINNLPGK